MKLSEDQIEELKGYYASYHRKCWAYKQAMKRLKQMRFAGNSLSVIFGATGIVSLPSPHQASVWLLFPQLPF